MTSRKWWKTREQGRRQGEGCRPRERKREGEGRGAREEEGGRQGERGKIKNPPSLTTRWGKTNYLFANFIKVLVK